MAALGFSNGTREVFAFSRFLPQNRVCPGILGVGLEQFLQQGIGVVELAAEYKQRDQFELHLRVVRIQDEALLKLLGARPEGQIRPREFQMRCLKLGVEVNCIPKLNDRLLVSAVRSIVSATREIFRLSEHSDRSSNRPVRTLAEVPTSAELSPGNATSD
jgi:hypothetical protein